MKKEQLQIAFSIFDKQSFAAFCIKIASNYRSLHFYIFFTLLSRLIK